MKRSTLLAAISAELGDRQLVWFGTRGDDIGSAADLPQLRAAFTIIGTYQGHTAVQAVSLEDLTGIRPDLDTFELDDEPETEALISLRRALLRTLARPSALFTYRPSTFVSAVCFARQDHCRYLGLFKDHQSAFEHKPWVESSIASLGLAHIPWTYMVDDDQLDTLRFLREGPVMLRRSRSSGGVGLTRVDEADQLQALWPREAEAYVSVAPYIADGLPVNVGGVVWHDGVTVHHASAQLIGIEGCTARPFGYCGNDFGAIGDLDRATVDEIDRNMHAIGGWLGSMGYRGAFGVDFLVKDGVPLFTEVNPRFQGSTAASCRLSVEQGESCLITEHLASNLGLAAPPSIPLREQYDRSGDLAQLVVHRPPGIADHVLDVPGLVARLDDATPDASVDVVAQPDTSVADAATIARVLVRERVTTTGFDLHGPLRTAVDAWNAARTPLPAGREG